MDKTNYSEKTFDFSRFPIKSRFLTFFIIVIVLFLALFGLITNKPAPQISNPIPGDYTSDLELYSRIISRIHQGQGYYTAAGYELRAAGFPTGSVFNWRPPLLALIFGALPNIKAGQIIVGLLSILGAALWIGAIGSELSFLSTLLSSLLLSGLIVSCFAAGKVYLAHEVWVGVCITISIGAYVKNMRSLSVFFGLFALFIRELSLIFVIIMCVMAFWERKYREAVIWLLGILLFFIMMLVHAEIIKNIQISSDYSYSTGWLAFGGWSFVLNVIHTHPYLMLFPDWVTAVFFPFALLGLLSWQNPIGTRVFLTVLTYSIAFLFVGKPFNIYWGFVFNNLIFLGIVALPNTFRIFYKNIFHA